MFSLDRRPARHAASTFAAAIALATGAVVTIVGSASPAYAQKQQKPDNSKGFIEVYAPVLELSKAEAPDEAALRAGIDRIVAAIETPDDRYAAGAFVNNVGVDLEDMALQQQGITLMIDSGKVPADQIGKFHYIVGQLAYNADDFATARAALQKAQAANHTAEALIPIIADTYFQEENFEAGLGVYKAEIDKLAAAGQTPPRDWISRGLSTAYNNDQAIPAIEFATMLVQHYPAKQTWRDAINIQRNLVLLEGPELLDLMRLADHAGTMNSDRDYLEYADAADLLRSPTEVKRILDKGIAAGVVDPNEPAVKDALAAANARAADDKADLAGLEADATAPSSTAELTTEAANAFLSHQMYDKAEALYAAALGKPGADQSLVNMRLGIAQLMQGKTAEAKGSFGKVTGQRRPIARLWSVYADQQAASATETAT